MNRQIIQPVLIHHLTGLLKNVSRRRIGIICNEFTPSLIPTTGHLPQPFPMNALLVRRLSHGDGMIIDAYPSRFEERCELPWEKVVIRQFWRRESAKLGAWQREWPQNLRTTPVLEILRRRLLLEFSFKFVDGIIFFLLVAISRGKLNI